MLPIGKMEFRCEEYPNMTLKLHPVTAILGTIEAEVRITLNIEKRMKKYLSKENIEKGETFYVYALRKRITDLTQLPKVYEELMARAMIRCREAKKMVIDSEISKLNKSLSKI